MLNTKEIVNGQEILEELVEGFGLSDYETVMEVLDKKTRCADFGNYTQVPVIKENNFISIKEFFEENDYFQGESMTVEELENELKYSDFEYIADNTYNYGGYLANEMNFIQLVNCDTDEAIVLFAVHVGLDVRAGYTNYFAFKFDSEWSFTEALLNRFNVAYVEFEMKNKKYYVHVDCQACYDVASLYIADDNHEDSYDFECCVDISDNEAIIDSIKEVLTENDIEFIENSFKVL